MPSLSALQKFRASFSDIGRERSDLESKGTPYIELDLPDTEAVPLEPEPQTPKGVPDTPSAAGASPAPDAGLAEPAQAPDDFDFSAFLDTVPDDLGGAPDAFAPEPERPAEQTPAGETPPAGTQDGGNLPDDLLAGFSGDLDAATFAEPEHGVPESAPESGGLDLGGDFPDLGSEAPDSSGESLDLGGDFPDLGGEASDSSGDSLDLGGDFPDLGSEAPDLSGEAPDLGSGGLDLSGESFDMGGEAPHAAPVADTAAAPGKDSGSSGEAHDDTDFTLPGIDDIFDDSHPVNVGKKPAAASRASSRAASSDDVEEIHLNDEEFDKFKQTLSGYPLNLRIACEELIAEQAVAPAQMSQLIKMLVNGAPAKETATLAGKILNRTISIPRGFQKSSGAAMEAEQASFAYIFIHKFLPMFRLFAMIAVLAGCLCYLIYKFIYTPAHAENLYKIGYERIFAGEYERANQRFKEAFSIHRKKVWFYRYAEAFRDERQYFYAEQKYDDLLRYYPRDKKGVLDYAALETYHLRNYEKADRLLRRELLDYTADDSDGLLALGDNSLAWGEIDSSKYEDARFAYARWLSIYGWKDPVVERMMKYFIRTDNLREVLPLYDYFTIDTKRKISAESLAELGGYLLDKQLEEQRGVPNEYIALIEGIRPLLLRAVNADPSLPESHYHLSRYYHNLGNAHEERITLEAAIKAFDDASQETIRRMNYRIDAQLRYANILINSREFFAAEESLVKGINLYEDALSRRLIARSPDFGKLYAGLGDLEYFTKSGDWEQALTYYHRAEQSGWSPPEIQYRMGRAYYQLEDWRTALEYFFKASADLPLNRRLLFALGNVSYQRGDYFASQGYFNRLLDILQTERSRLPALLPNDRPEYQEVAERLMMALNNAGAVYEALAERTGNQGFRSRAMGLYSESSRAWDTLTRNPQTMIRSGSIPLPQLNARNTLYPQRGYEPQLFIHIDTDVLEPSYWEYLVAPNTY